MLNGKPPIQLNVNLLINDAVAGASQQNGIAELKVKDMILINEHLTLIL
jgi:hypothetical protein